MIYICIPALNEARTIGVLLWKIRQVMEEFPRDYHILVLDDGSTDDTSEVLEPYVRVLPATVLRNERTQGYPAALEKLIREAARLSTHPKRDVVVTLQADFTENPDDIPNLLKRVEGGADVVGTSVTGTEGELTRALRWSRRGLPWLLTRAPLPKEVKDPLSGFRAYRVSVLKRALQERGAKPLLTKHGWAANAELLLCVAPHVRRADDAEVRLRYTRRERPTRFRAWNTAVELWDLARKAPRRMAEARAAIAAAPPEAPDAPGPQAERTADRPLDRGPRPERGPRPDRGPRPERGGQADRGPAAPARAAARACAAGRARTQARPRAAAGARPARRHRAAGRARAEARAPAPPTPRGTPRGRRRRGRRTGYGRRGDRRRPAPRGRGRRAGGPAEAPPPAPQARRQARRPGGGG